MYTVLRGAVLSCLFHSGNREGSLVCWYLSTSICWFLQLIQWSGIGTESSWTMAAMALWELGCFAKKQHMSLESVLHRAGGAAPKAGSTLTSHWEVLSSSSAWQIKGELQHFSRHHSPGGTVLLGDCCPEWPLGQLQVLIVFSGWLWLGDCAGKHTRL